MRNEVGQRLEGVAIGVLLGFGEQEEPMVVFAGNPRETAMAARTTAALAAADVGGEVALLFEGGDAARPLVIGRVLQPAMEPETSARLLQAAIEVVRDGERLELRRNRRSCFAAGRRVSR